MIVSDTGPINDLLLIGHIGVLESLFGEVAIPPAVLRELTQDDTPERVRTWIESQPAWITVKESPALARHRDLDPGEAEAIALAKRLGAPILCDDKAGRRVANQEGLVVSGTLGVLQAAHLRSLLKLDDALLALSQTTFHRAEGLFEGVYEQTMRLERERN